MNFQNFFETLSRGGPNAGAGGAAPASSVPEPSVSVSSSGGGSGGGGGGGGGGSQEEGASGRVVGLEVAQPAFIYAVGDAGLAHEDLPHPQCTPIAFYNSDAPYGSGRLIAVSDAYICYAIKDGHIRGINRSSVQRTLLKGHKKPVIDMAFAPKATCTLASLGGEGSFFLWTIVETPAEDKKLMPVPLLTVVNAQLERVVWHPVRTHLVAVAGPNGQVALVDTHALIAALGGGKPGSGPAPQVAAGGMGDLRPEWQVSAHGGSRVLDLSFSQDGKYLVTAGADGWTRVWDVEARNAVARWQPYGGSPVTRALFLHRTRGGASGEKMFVVTGGQQDAEVKLWRAWTTLTPINTQTLSLQPAGSQDDGKGRAFHLDADESGEFLLLADHFRASLYVAHVVLGPSSAKIDRLTPFQLKHPVLSFLALPGVAVDAHGGQASGAAEVQLYCVQTQAIQIYHIKPAECAAGPVANKPAAAVPPQQSPALTPVTPAAPSTAAASGGAGAGGSSQQQQPDIFSMLLNASQAATPAITASAPAPASAASGAARATATTGSSGAAGGLISPQSLAAVAGGGGGGGGARGPRPPLQQEEEAASTQQSAAAALSEEKQTGGARTTEAEKGGSRSASSSSLAGQGTGAPAPAQAPVQPVAPVAPIPPPQPPAMEAAAVIAGAGVGAGAGNADAAVLARVDAVLRERTEALAAATRHAVVDALGGGGGRGGDQLQRRVEAAVRAAVAGQLEGVPAQVAASAREAAVAGLAGAVKEPVASSFRECFEKMLIPAMQTTTQRMFAQMSEALNKNLTAATAGGAAGGGGGGPGAAAAVAQVRSEVGEVKSQLTALAGAVNALAAQLSRLEARGGVARAAANGGMVGGGKREAGLDESVGGGASTPGRASVKEQLRGLVRQGRYNEAFQQALGASDLELVTWLCAEAPRDAIFDAEPPLLSQTILLCLMQQLSFQLGKHAGVKLEWLKQIALVFNPFDPEVASFVGQVLAQLRENLDGAAPEVVALGDAERGRDFKFVLRAVKKMEGAR